MTDNLAKRVSAFERSVAGCRSQMIDPDSIMTEKDYAALLRYRKEQRAGRLLSHEQLDLR